MALLENLMTPRRIDPNLRKVLQAIRGYDFKSAIADIVDNAIDAATNGFVRIRIDFVIDRQGTLSAIRCCDDGHGMDQGTLIEAMRFGADGGKGEADLGKFGMGLKVASFSQAKELRVATKRAESFPIGLLGDIEEIKESAKYHDLGPPECKDAFDRWVGSQFDTTHGTVVEWRQLSGHLSDPGEGAQIAARLQRETSTHVGLTFHRLIGRKCEISTVIIEDDEMGIPVHIVALDPFACPTPLASFSPVTGSVDYHGSVIRVRAAIWNPLDKAHAGFSLPGGKVKRQGLYWYRNDRLLRGGGWDDLLPPEVSDSDLVLARLSIDIPAKLDESLGLNVEKTGVSLRAGPLQRKLWKVELKNSKERITMVTFLNRARDAAKKRGNKGQRGQAILPSAGLPHSLRSKIRERLRIKRPTEISIRWTNLDSERLFDVDKESMTLWLNSEYRERITGGRNTGADAPVFKTLIYMLTSEQFLRSRTSKKNAEWMRFCEEVTLAAVKHVRDEE
jgi:hypothetical protein